MVGCHTGVIKVRAVEPKDLEYGFVALLSASSSAGAHVGFVQKLPLERTSWCGPEPRPTPTKLDRRLPSSATVFPSLYVEGDLNNTASSIMDMPRGPEDRKSKSHLPYPSSKTKAQW
jgi:hypothetical protein